MIVTSCVAMLALTAAKLTFGPVENNAPAGWKVYEWEGYRPGVKVEFAADEKGGCVRLEPSSAGYGFALLSNASVPTREGDIVTLAFEAKGTGTGICMLTHADAKDAYLCNTPRREFPLTDAWTEHVLDFTLSKAKRGVIAQSRAHIGEARGSSASFRNVRILRRLRRNEVALHENFESPGAGAGACTIVRGDITTGLLTQTAMGRFATSSRVELVRPVAQRAPDDERTFLRSGLRLYSLAGGSGRIEMAFSAGTDGFSLVIAPLNASGDVRCTLPGGETFAVSRAKLPADIVFAVSRGGIADLSVASLADSSTEGVTGRCAFPSGAAEVRQSIALVADGGEAVATVDEVFVDRAEYVRQEEADFPYRARPADEFDPVKAGWPLVFADEFDGTVIDETKWNIWGKHPGRTAEHRADFAQLDGKGVLRIKADLVPGSNLVQTASLWSKPGFLYGYFESRLKFTRENGWWAAFWACVRGGIDNAFLDGMEIDFFEDYFLRGPKEARGDLYGKLDHNHHIGCGGPHKSRNYNSKLEGSPDEWHVLGVKWTPFEITYYMNGKVIRTEKVNHSPYETVTFDAFRHGTSVLPLHAIVSGQRMKHLSPDVDLSGCNFPEYYLVDYVRVYACPETAADQVPSVTLDSSTDGEFLIPRETQVTLSADVKSAAATGAKVRAVHFFDGGFHIATVTNAPYVLKFPFSERFFGSTAWSRGGRQGIRTEFASGAVHAFCAFAEDELGRVGHSRVIAALPKPPKPSTPFRGKAHAVPGTIPAGHYDEGGEGVAYHDRNPANEVASSWRTNEGVDATESAIGYIANGEWINYTIDVARTGRYRLRNWYGTPIADRSHEVWLLVDGVKRATLELKPHDDRCGYNCDTVAETELELEAGRHVLMWYFRFAGNFGKTVIEEL